jgi:hypothetical protein
MSTPFLIGPVEIEALHQLREMAAAHPVDMQKLVPQLKNKKGKRRHMDQMNRQSVMIPVEFLVTFSIETGHPAGTCRHMSMSSPAPGRVPLPEAIWMAAEELGFIGGLERCMVWLEDLTQGKAVNVVQPLAVQQEGKG